MSANIAVFELGEIPAELDGSYPVYSTMIADWLAPSMPLSRFTGISIVGGESLPEIHDFDGYVYSGSRHGVYDGLPWIEPLKQFIRQVADSARPQFGICFGHQIIAEALGGKAVKSERGWGAGVHVYQMQLDMDSTEVSQIPVMVMHQDQVIELPDSASVIGGNDFCPLGAVRYAQPALTVQFHPEFSRDYMLELVKLRAGVTIPQDRAEQARASLEQTTDAGVIADWAANFFSERTRLPV